MGPIDIKYHVVSIVAVFLALGVGIVVGSNSNLIGTNTMIDRQNAIISGLEENYREMRQEMEETKAFLGETGEYVKTLETKTIPVLLEGKLSGFRFGLVSVGTVPPDVDPTDATVKTLKEGGAENAFTVSVNEELLRESAGADPDVFIRNLARELLNGNAAAAAGLVENGKTASAGPAGPVDGVLFVLGENLDESFLKDMIVPLQLRIREADGIVSSLTVGENKAYWKILSRDALPLVQNAETLPARMEVAADLAKRYANKKERDYSTK